MNVFIKKYHKLILYISLVLLVVLSFVVVLNRKESAVIIQENPTIDPLDPSKDYRLEEISSENPNDVFFYLVITEKDINEKYGSKDKMPKGSMLDECDPIYETSCYYFVPFRYDQVAASKEDKLKFAIQALLELDSRFLGNLRESNDYGPSKQKFGESLEFLFTYLNNRGRCLSEDCKKADVEISFDSNNNPIIDFTVVPYSCISEGYSPNWQAQIEKTIKLYYSEFTIMVNGGKETYDKFCCYCAA